MTTGGTIPIDSRGAVLRFSLYVTSYLIAVSDIFTGNGAHCVLFSGFVF